MTAVLLTAALGWICWVAAVEFRDAHRRGVARVQAGRSSAATTGRATSPDALPDFFRDVA